MTFTTRFAPSPTGPLHLGHAYSALLAHDMAMAEGGKFLLRIEDIDQSRARPQWETQIYEDLEWLGLWWPKPVMRQSERQSIYDQALDRLWQLGLLYPCTCNRKDIAAAAAAPQEGSPLLGPDGVIYPGTCRGPWEQVLSDQHQRPQNVPLRLDMEKAIGMVPGLFQNRRVPGKPFASFGSFLETGNGPNGERGLVEFTPDNMVKTIGDVVLSRRGMGTSYHLSVVLDDAAQGVNHVIRGQDLFEATRIHILLQALLNLPHPTYHHHSLIRDEAGKRLAKRDDARAISTYRQDGANPQDIRELVGLG